MKALLLIAAMLSFAGCGMQPEVEMPGPEVPDESQIAERNAYELCLELGATTSYVDSEMAELQRLLDLGVSRQAATSDLVRPCNATPCFQCADAMLIAVYGNP